MVPLRELTLAEDDNLMRPIEPEILNLLYGSTEKGAAERYLIARNKKSPEDRFVLIRSLFEMISFFFCCSTVSN